jgi:rhamnogalacturonyl hydrolase YesR
MKDVNVKCTNFTSQMWMDTIYVPDKIVSQENKRVNKRKIFETRIYFFLRLSVECKID